MDYPVTVKCEIVERLQGKVFKVYRKKSDDDYVAERNKFIPAAEKFANKNCGIVFRGASEAEREAWVGKWNGVFLLRMDELARNKGI